MPRDMTLVCPGCQAALNAAEYASARRARLAGIAPWASDLCATCVDALSERGAASLRRARQSLLKGVRAGETLGYIAGVSGRPRERVQALLREVGFIEDSNGVLHDPITGERVRS